MRLLTHADPGPLLSAARPGPLLSAARPALEPWQAAKSPMLGVYGRLARDTDPETPTSFLCTVEAPTHPR